MHKPKKRIKIVDLRPLTDGQEPVLMPMAAEEREGLGRRVSKNFGLYYKYSNIDENWGDITKPTLH